MRNSPCGITVPFRANATINKFRILRRVINEPWFPCMDRLACVRENQAHRSSRDDVDRLAEHPSLMRYVGGPESRLAVDRTVRLTADVPITAPDSRLRSGSP